jgi:hypothetical protein
MDIKSFNINNLDWLCWQSLQFGEMQGEDPVRAHKQKGAAEVGHREDPDLLSRCGDLLIASYNFDRAINQATLVLEDRIRKKAQPPSSSGETLSLRSLGESRRQLVAQFRASGGHFGKYGERRKSTTRWLRAWIRSSTHIMMLVADRARQCESQNVLASGKNDVEHP